MSAPASITAEKSRAGRLPLVGGALCLNFVNTASGRGTSRHLDHLRRFEHLLAWARHAGAIAEADARALAASASRKPRAAHRALLRAVALRESLYALFHAAVSGATPPSAALAKFNRALAKTMAAAAIEPTAAGFAWNWPAHSPQPERLIWPITRSAAELLTAGNLSRVKICPGHNCGWLFLDTSRNGRRRWCEMEVCGSRAKMRRYHQRRRRAAAADSPF